MKIGILWDLDGTLLNTLQDLTDSVNYVLRQYGYAQRAPEEIRSFLGNGARQLIFLSMGQPEDGDLVDRVLKDYQAYYKEHSQIKTKPYDGILQVLEQLKKKYAMAVVTNKPDAPAKLLCAQHFPGVYTVGEMSDCPRKPASDMVWRAMQALDLEGCVYVGDSEVDVLTAKNANVPCMSVLWGFRDREELEQAGGRYFCETPHKAAAMIETIVGEYYGK